MSRDESQVRHRTKNSLSLLFLWDDSTTHPGTHFAGAEEVVPEDCVSSYLFSPLSLITKRERAWWRMASSKSKKEHPHHHNITEQQQLKLKKSIRELKTGEGGRGHKTNNCPQSCSCDGRCQSVSQIQTPESDCIKKSQKEKYLKT